MDPQSQEEVPLALQMTGMAACSAMLRACEWERREPTKGFALGLIRRVKDEGLALDAVRLSSAIFHETLFHERTRRAAEEQESKGASKRKPAAGAKLLLRR